MQDAGAQEAATGGGEQAWPGCVTTLERQPLTAEEASLSAESLEMRFQGFGKHGCEYDRSGHSASPPPTAKDILAFLHK